MDEKKGFFQRFDDLLEEFVTTEDYLKATKQLVDSIADTNEEFSKDLTALDGRIIDVSNDVSSLKGDYSQFKIVTQSAHKGISSNLSTLVGRIQNLENDFNELEIPEYDEEAIATTAINLLESYTGDDRLDAKAIKNLEENIDVSKLNLPKFDEEGFRENFKSEILKLLPKNPPMYGGGSGATFLKSMRDVNLDGLTKDSKGRYILGSGGGGISDIGGLIEAGTNISLTGSGTTEDPYVISATGEVGGTVAWGSLTGTLSDQTDLQAALDAKAASSHTHAISDVTNLQTTLDAKVVGPASATDNAIVRFDGTTGKLVQNSSVVIDDTGNVGIGTASPGYPLQVSNIDTSTSGAKYGNYTLLSLNASATSTGLYAATNAITSVTTSNNYTGAYGTGGVVGGLYVVRNTGTGTVTHAYGLLPTVQNTSTGAITNAYSIFIPNAYKPSGTISTNYGLYIQGQTAGTNNYAIYSAGGTNYFAGNTSIGVTDSTTAKLVIGQSGSGVQSILNLTNGQTSAAGVGSQIGFYGAGGAYQSTIQSVWEDAGSNAYLRFATRKAGTVTEALRITGSGNVGIGTAAPNAKLDVLSTTEQLRLTYTDGSVYTSFTTSSGGDLTIAPSGGDTNVTGNLAVSGDITVSDEAYGSGWDGSTEVPTKNAIYDKIEALVVGGGGYTDEEAQDAVGGILTDSSEIDFTYDDATPSITASLKTGSVDVLKLDAGVQDSLALADSAVQDLSDLGITATATELNYVDGVTSAIQTQLDAKLESSDLSGYLQTSDVDDTPVNGATTAPVSSNWAFDHEADTSTHGVSGAIVGTTDTQTLTNKRIQPRTSSTTSTSTLTPDVSSYNQFYLTAQAASLTLAAPTGTPVIGETIAVYVYSASAQTLSFNATYKPMGQALPSTTTAGKWMEVIARYNGTNWLTSYTVEQ